METLRLSSQGGEKSNKKHHELPREECDICGLRLEDECWVESSKKYEPELVLCPICYNQSRFPCVYIQSDFHKLELTAKSERKNSEYPPSRQLELINDLKEIGFNVARFKELEAKFGPPKEIIKHFLKYPLKNFNQSYRLSNSGMENLFKKREKKTSVVDEAAHQATINQLAFIKLLIDGKKLSPEHDKATESADATLALLVAEHRQEIDKIEADLKTKLNNCAQRARLKIFSELE